MMHKEYLSKPLSDLLKLSYIGFNVIANGGLYSVLENYAGEIIITYSALEGYLERGEELDFSEFNFESKEIALRFLLETLIDRGVIWAK